MLILYQRERLRINYPNFVISPYSLLIERLLEPALADINIKYKIDPDCKDQISIRSMTILKEMLFEINVKNATISSTRRSYEHQAQIMISLIENKGINKAYSLYGENGDQVIKVYKDAKKAQQKPMEIKNSMIKKIEQLSREGKLVSKHCVSIEIYAKYNVFDISPDSIPQLTHDIFKEVLQIYKTRNKITHFIPFKDNEPAFHIEIKQEGA
jgi:hypothetical protein